MKEKADPASFLLKKTPWSEETDPIWPATSFLLRRNLARNFFPPKMTESQSLQLLDLLKNALFDAGILKEPLLFKAEELSPIDKEFLYEHFLCLEGFQNTLKGQGFAIEESAKFFTLLNVQDHLQLHLLDAKGGWEKPFSRIGQIEAAIGKKLEYAFSAKFGYLTADPSLAGTGLVVSVFLHLAALIHTGQLSEILLKQKEEDIRAISLQGPIENCVGDIIVLQNAFTLGQSEDAILRSLHAFTMKLSSLEKAARNALKTKENPQIKDQISRALGLLLHSYQLQTKEAMDALSLIKLGIYLGWIKGISDAKVSDIFFKCRHAHLLKVFKETKALSQDELAQKRAEFIHQELKGMEII